MAKSDNAARAQAAANTRKLIDWAADAVSKPLPDAVRRAAIILSDDIGAMVAGSLETQVARAREGLLRTSSAKAEATVLAKGAPRADRYAAASANGMAITWCELDEGFRNASCHGGAYTIPALLAEAEAQGRTVEEVLRALAVAYEVTTRFALAFPFPVFNVHPHAAFAAIGGAAAASLARRQDSSTMLAAVTGGASMSFAGPFDTAVEGALIRNAWTSAGAWLGLRAADWAEAGIGGNDVTPYDVFVGAYKTRDRLVADPAARGPSTTATTKCLPAAPTRIPRSRRRSTCSAACARKKKRTSPRSWWRPRRADRRCATRSPRPCWRPSSPCRTRSRRPCTSAAPARAPSPRTSCATKASRSCAAACDCSPTPT